MKIILDHSAPAPLARFLPGNEVWTCGTLRWNRMGNRELLAVAEAAGFDLMITSDQSISYQQNLSKRRISLNRAWLERLEHRQAARNASIGSVKAAFEAVA